MPQTEPYHTHRTPRYRNHRTNTQHRTHNTRKKFRPSRKMLVPRSHTSGTPWYPVVHICHRTYKNTSTRGKKTSTKKNPQKNSSASPPQTIVSCFVFCVSCLVTSPKNHDHPNRLLPPPRRPSRPARPRHPPHGIPLTQTHRSAATAAPHCCPQSRLPFPA